MGLLYSTSKSEYNKGEGQVAFGLEVETGICGPIGSSHFSLNQYFTTSFVGYVSMFLAMFD